MPISTLKVSSTHTHVFTYIVTSMQGNQKGKNCKNIKGGKKWAQSCILKINKGAALTGKICCIQRGAYLQCIHTCYVLKIRQASIGHAAEQRITATIAKKCQCSKSKKKKSKNKNNGRKMCAKHATCNVAPFFANFLSVPTQECVVPCWRGGG